MIQQPIQVWLFAQRSNWEHLGKRFSGEQAEVSLLDMVAMGCAVLFFVAAVLLLKKFASLWDGTSSIYRPQGLFRELCRAHQLNRADRQLLKHLASLGQLEHPAMLFVQPERFERANLPEELEASTEELAQLRDRLFAG